MPLLKKEIKWLVRDQIYRYLVVDAAERSGSLTLGDIYNMTDKVVDKLAESDCLKGATE